MKSKRILYIQYTDPVGYPPLEHSATLLGQQGWHIDLLGTETANSVRLEFLANPRIRVRRLRFAYAGWRQKVQYAFFVVWAIYWSRRLRPEWLYASDALACPVVWWARKVTGARVLYHEHDSPNCDQVQTWFMQKV